MKFIHLTDTHLVPPGSVLEGLDPAVRLRAAVASINAEHGDADCVVMTGDLTNAGEVGAYEVLRDAIALLSMPVHLMLGNHDNPKTLVDVMPGLKALAENDFQTCLETAEGRLILLNTHQPGTDAGGFPKERQDWLRDVLESSTDGVFLFMHHPPFAVGMPAMDTLRLDEPGIWQVLEPHAARIRHLFFGHLHRPVWGNWRGISYSGMRGVNHQMALDMVTEAPDFYASHEPPAYGVVLVKPDQVTVHLHDFENSGGWFKM